MGGNDKISRSERDARKDRRSATGKNGSPKKGGHGGKFTWSGDGYSPEEMIGASKNKAPIDVNDPNFEDPEDKAPISGAADS